MQEACALVTVCMADCFKEDDDEDTKYAGRLPGSKTIKRERTLDLDDFLWNMHPRLF